MFESWPFTNFHDLNLDWIVGRIKNVETSEANAKASEESASASATSAAASKISAAASATSASNSADTISDAARQIQINTDRIDTIVANAGDVSGNSELTDIRVGYNGVTYPTAGDAVRGQIETIADALNDYNTGDQAGGITYTNSGTGGVVAITGSGRYTLNGTATQAINHNVYVNAAAFPGNLKPGDYVLGLAPSTNAGVYYEIFYYVNGGWDYNRKFSGTYQFKIPANATGVLIRLHINNGTICSNDTLQFMKLINYRDSIGDQPPVMVPDTGYDVASLAESMLADYSQVYMLPGEYFINTPIDMPDNTRITGCGYCTHLDVGANANGINAGANTTIENFRITSQGAHTQDKGSASGISVVGNLDSAPFKYNVQIRGMYISGFSCADIYGYYTGYWVANSLTIDNCVLTSAYAGVLLEGHAEFARICNCNCYNNYIGFCNKSGNNKAVNCDFSNNTVGVYLFGQDGTYSDNNGHGSIVGCTINHSNNNTGYAVIANSINNGFTFADCNIWYSKVFIENCNAIMFNGCIFGGGTPNIENRLNTSKIILLNNLFQVVPTITGTVIKDNNYTLTGVSV